MPKKALSQKGKITKCFDLIQKTANILYVIGRYKLRNKEIYFGHDPTGLVSLSMDRRIGLIAGVNKYYCGACSHIPKSLQMLFVTDHHILVPFFRVGPIHLEIISLNNNLYKPTIVKFTLNEFLRNKSRYLSILSEDFNSWLDELMENDMEIFSHFRISSPSVSLYTDKDLYSFIRDIKCLCSISCIEKSCDLLIDTLKSINKDLFWNKYRTIH